MFLLILAIFGWQVQGGHVQQVQRPSHEVQHATITIQGDQESGDNMQNALGWRAYQ